MLNMNSNDPLETKRNMQSSYRCFQQKCLMLFRKTVKDVCVFLAGLGEQLVASNIFKLKLYNFAIMMYNLIKQCYSG